MKRSALTSRRARRRLDYGGGYGSFSGFGDFSSEGDATGSGAGVAAVGADGRGSGGVANNGANESLLTKALRNIAWILII